MFVNVSKSERLIYVTILMWLLFGILGVHEDIDLPSLGGYYASLSLFIGTYLWGEHKRESNSTKLLNKGKNSSREIVIYLTILMWLSFGLYGIIESVNVNNLTVYFSSLSPFVSSYIVYKTTKKYDTPKEHKNHQ